MANGKTVVRKDLMAVVQRSEGGKGYWTKIGVAFLMDDGTSWNIKQDFYPANATITKMQLRDPLPARSQGSDPGDDLLLEHLLHDDE